MSCSSCGTKTNGAPSGCKSNGTCGTSGCNALNVYDWFKDMDLPDDYERFNIVEVRYKGSRKEYYRNSEHIDLYNGDYVLTESNMGYDLGTVSATGEIVRLQLKKLRLSEDSEQIRKIIRVANEKEIEKYNEQKEKENSTLEKARTICFELKLAMKLSDIEIQGDGRKVTFFYTAESRVDFRELIRRFADQFRMKIEMRHISYREEASRLGGMGDCGRPLCCSTWLTDYKMVNTGAARIQNLSINMEKLAGQCGRLKCCLNYELDTYVEAMDEFPKAKIVKLDTIGGMAYGRKSDILKRLMWFSYEDSQTWVPVPITKVNEIMEHNKQGKQGPNLSDLAPASQVMEKVAGGHQGEEMINNEEMLKEDREFEDELRRQREEKNKNIDTKNQGGNRPPGKFQNKDRRENPNPRPNRGNTPQSNVNIGPRPENKNTTANKPNPHPGGNRNNPNNNPQNRNQNRNKNRRPPGNNPNQKPPDTTS